MKIFDKKHICYLILLFVLPFLNGCQKDDVIVQCLFDLSGAPLLYDDSQATKFLNVVSVSLEVARDKETNMRQIENVCRRAVFEHPETELILFGESILGWYTDDDAPVEYQRSISEPVPGPATDRLSVLADSLNIYLVAGLIENKADTLFNAQILINPEGETVAVHRKINLTPEDEKNGITAGKKELDNVILVKINGIQTGMIICADVSGYWLTKQLIDHQAELILHSLASTVSDFTVDAVARQYNAWEVFANRYGDEGSWSYSGTTYIADPAGTIRSVASGDAVFMFYKIAVR